MFLDQSQQLQFFNIEDIKTLSDFFSHPKTHFSGWKRQNDKKSVCQQKVRILKKNNPKKK